MELSSQNKAYLKGLAHSLKPFLHVGKNGVNDQFLEELASQLKTHELLKIRFADFKDEKDELIATIETRSQAICVGKIGHVAIFYRETKDKKKKNKITFQKNIRGETK